MATKQTKSAPRATTGTSTRTSAPRRAQRAEAVSRDEIARRAYENFLARGGAHGQDVEDWLRAEKELIGR